MSSLTTNSLRTSLRRAASCSRYSSSQTSSFPHSSSSSNQKLDVQPKTELTEDKMRALVDLYHQSSTFITKANLSDRIDDAFIRRRKDYRYFMQPVERSMPSLEVDLYQRRNRPKFGQMRPTASRKANDQPQSEAQEWSEQRSVRETAVFSTLYGVYSRAKPAYDALMDEQRGPEVEEEVEEKDALEAERQQLEGEPPKGEQSSA